MTRAGPLQHVSAGGMSLLAHGLLLVLLFIGVSWQTLPPRPVEAELWNALPAAPAPRPPVAIPAPPPPQVESTPKPAEIKPDIALERAEKKRIAQEAQHQEAARLAQEAQHQEAARLAQEAQHQEAARLAQEQAAAQATRLEQLRRTKERRLLEQELTSQAREELDSEDSQLRGALQKQQNLAGRKASLIREAQERIRSRIQSYVILPRNLVGNPEAVYLVILLPNGEVLRIVQRRSSGQAPYDQEVERAIRKASPLPLPSDHDAAAAFREGLILRFRPKEDTVAGD